MADTQKGGYRICVYCQKCGTIATTDIKAGHDDFGNPVYLWHQPCHVCGTTAWATKFIGSVTPFDNKK